MTKAKSMPMKVHIVCPEWESDWVIARLARYLVEGNGWTVSTEPDPTALANIFMLYLDWRHTEWRDTPTAALFTHREDSVPAKAAIWDATAPKVDIRVTAAMLYLQQLLQHGPTLHLPYPVERAHFTLGPKRGVNGRPRVGVSGFVYEYSGRKGGATVRRLANDKVHKLDVVASGRGWPVPTKMYSWDEMPSYYQGLDVFLCASTVEGGPLPVFEALACGVPVVIPTGVGQMDELPEMPGVHHYQPGDYESMVLAIDDALVAKYDRDALHALTEGCTVEGWCEGWIRAVSMLIDTEIEPEAPGPDWQECSGVYVVAYGAPARKCAKLCLTSVKEQLPELKRALASTEPLGIEDIFLDLPDLDVGGRSIKTQIYDKAPAEWHYVLYLDADTEMVAPVPFLFQVLQDGWDVVFCINPGKYHVASKMRRPDNEDECQYTYRVIGTSEVLQLQGGVFAFRRNDRTARLFRAWHREWQRYGKRDQGALLRAIHENSLRLLMLGVEWNTSDRYVPEERTAGIIHRQMQARRWEGLIDGRNDSDQAWEKVRQWEKNH